MPPLLRMLNHSESFVRNQASRAIANCVEDRIESLDYAIDALIEMHGEKMAEEEVRTSKNSTSKPLFLERSKGGEDSFKEWVGRCMLPRR